LEIFRERGEERKEAEKGDEGKPKNRRWDMGWRLNRRIREVKLWQPCLSLVRN